jgi:outer membrane protein TolC
MREKKKITLKLILSIIFFAQAADLFSMDIKESINSLYQNNQKLKSEQEKVLESKANLASGVLSLFPDIQYSQNLKQKLKATTVQNIESSVDGIKKKTLIIQENLSIGGTILSPIISHKNLEYSKINFKFSEMQILMEALSSYLSVLEKQELLNASSENFEIAKKTSQLIQKQFDVGETTKTQVQYSLSTLALRESIMIKAKGALVSANASYKKIFGVAPNNLVFPQNVPKNIPKKFEEFAKFCLDNNLYLKLSNSRTDISRLSVLASTSQTFPNASFVYQNTKNDLPKNMIRPDINKEESIYQVSLNIPILPRGGSEYSKILSSKFAYNRSLSLQKYAIEEINEEILSSWENLSISESNLKAAQSAHYSAKEAMNAMRKEYELGTRSVLELLESEKQYYETNVNLISAKNQRILAYYSALVTMGILNKDSFLA